MPLCPDFIVLDIEDAVNQIHSVLELQDYSLLEDDMVCLIDIMIFNPLDEAIIAWTLLFRRLGIYSDTNLEVAMQESHRLIQLAAAESFDPIDNYKLHKVTDCHAFLCQR